MQYATYKKLLVSSNTAEIIATVTKLCEENRAEILHKEAKLLIVESNNIFAIAKELCAALNPLIKKDTNISFLEKEEVVGFSTFAKLMPLETVCNKLESMKLMQMLEDESFLTYFHQIFDLRNDTLFGYETLLRGVYNGAMVPPQEIFSMASKSDSLFVLDRIARSTNLKYAAKHNVDKNIFINFIPTAIYDPAQCLKSTVALADELGINPRNIVFEVVETEKVDDTEHLKSILDYYKNRGFRVALDDVGNGYSNLNLIAKLKPDIIKIDREIIDRIEGDDIKKSIFEALVNIASKNNILVLAEGIERQEELDYVRKNGADLAQGYCYSKPSEKPL